MLLQVRPLVEVGSVNTFRYASQWSIFAGNPETLTFQLVDASKNKDPLGMTSGLRYVPASGATLTLTLISVDDAKQIVRTCTQPYSGDLSIWQLALLATDTISGTVSIKIDLLESGAHKYGLSQGILKISASDCG